MKKVKDTWYTDSFLTWWEKTKREKGHNQLSSQQLAFMTWLAAIDYYIDNIEEKPSPYPSPEEETAGLSRLVSMDALYDDEDSKEDN